MASKKTKDRKYQLAEELQEHLKEYKTIFLVDCDNVGSNQLHEIRKALRGTALIYGGKNTQMRRVIREMEEENPKLEQVRSALKLNTMLVFTNESAADVKDLIESNKMPAAARAGALAQVDVTIPKGITSLEPSQTSFLQALNIGTKITKGQIEIIADVELLKAGVKVDSSQAALLQKMGMLPFAYGLIVRWVYDQGSLFPPAVLEIDANTIMNSFRAGCRELAALSFATDIPSEASVPYALCLGFKDLCAIALETDVHFEQMSKIKAYLDDPSAFACAGPATGGGGGAPAAAAAAAPAEESEEEEEMATGGGLFGEEGDDY